MTDGPDESLCCGRPHCTHTHAHGAFSVRHSRVTVEWHEVSAAAGRVGGGGGGGEYGGRTVQQVITDLPLQPTVLRHRGGPGRKVLLLSPLKWRVACLRRPRNRSASTRRLNDSCGVTRGMPGENSNSCCLVSTCYWSFARHLCGERLVFLLIR